MRAALASSTPSPAPFSYAAPENSALHDDDPARGPNPGSGCEASAAGAAQLDGATHLAQMRPYPGDRPAKRIVEVWALVRLPTSATSPELSWSISPPGASAPIALSGARLSPSDCTTLGDAAMAGTMLNAAAGTGQVSRAVAGDTHDGMVARCARGEAAIYHAVFPLSFLEACGAYRLEAAIQGAAGPKRLSSSFDVDCYADISRDFESVGWGNVAAGQELWLTGDLAWGGPSASHPTLKNDGNAPARVALVFEALAPLDSADPRSPRIERFGACLAKDAREPVCLRGIRAGVAADFGPQLEVVLCPGELARLDLSVLPGTGVAAGGYSGSLSIKGTLAGVSCPANPGG